MRQSIEYNRELERSVDHIQLMGGGDGGTTEDNEPCSLTVQC